MTLKGVEAGCYYLRVQRVEAVEGGGCGCGRKVKRVGEVEPYGMRRSVLCITVFHL